MDRRRFAPSPGVDFLSGRLATTGGLGCHPEASRADDTGWHPVRCFFLETLCMLAIVEGEASSGDVVTGRQGGGLEA